MISLTAALGDGGSKGISFGSNASEEVGEDEAEEDDDDDNDDDACFVGVNTIDVDDDECNGELDDNEDDNEDKEDNDT